MLKNEIAKKVKKPGNKTLLEQLTPSQIKELHQFAAIFQDDPAFVESHGLEGIARFFKQKWKRDRLAAKTLRAHVNRINGKP